MASVEGELRYLARRSSILRRFTAPGASANTGEYDTHVVTICSSRMVADSFRLDVHGFEIVEHSSAVTDFTDKAEVDAVYVPEVTDFVNRMLAPPGLRVPHSAFLDASVRATVPRRSIEVRTFVFFE